jgi:hypothetical protein
MRKQLDLFERPPLTAVPAPGISQPRVWVRRLVVWEKPGQKLRDISLRPGLNIVWSPDPAEVGMEAEVTAMLGHGSGKTLFCRLLRYCLGEERYAPEGQRGDIAAAMPEGMVGAEVLVDGVPWSVVRPLGHRRRHLAAPAVDLEEFADGEDHATGIEPLTNAISATVMTDAVGRILPRPAENQAWLTAIALLARDQECRFDDVLDWRSHRSGSTGSPVRDLSRTGMLDALRALIGAVDPAELALRGELAALERKRAAAANEANHQEVEATRKRQRLIAALGLAETEIPPGELAAEVFRRSAVAKLAREMGTPQNDVGPDMRKLREKRLSTQDRIRNLQKERDQLDGAFPATSAQLKMVESELPGAEGKLFLAGNPMCQLCEVPIDRVLAEGCKLSHKLPDLNAAREKRQWLLEQQKALGASLKRIAARRATLEKEIGDAEANLGPLDELLTTLEEAQDARSDAWYEARRLTDDVEQLNVAMAGHEHADAEAKALEAAIKDLRERSATLRGTQAEHFGSLAKHFDTVIRGLAGQEAEGIAKLTGNGLDLEVRMGGNRSTPAIDSLKVVAFDLAVLLLSIEGKTHMPAFLVHDSPREADLGASIYGRLFELPREMEEIGGNPLFQYIVTTTTRPPENVRRDPWLRLTLRGGPPEERLLRRDL